MADPERFLCAPGLRIDALERLSDLQFAQLAAQLHKIEAGFERLERRLWMAVYGVAGVILAQAFLSILELTP